MWTRTGKAPDAIRSRCALSPQVGIVLGTGLGDFTGALESPTAIHYSDIPGFPVSTVESHAGEMHIGRLGARAVAVMQGRVHYYEGYSMQQVAFPARVLRELGCNTLVLTSAVGGMNPDMPAGTI